MNGVDVFVFQDKEGGDQGVSWEYPRLRSSFHLCLSFT